MIYVLRAGNVYKIGNSSNPQRRLSNIQRMSPTLLELVWQHSGGLELESHLHQEFTKHCSHGEWFIFEEDPLPAIKQAVEDYLGKLDDTEELDSGDIWDL